MTAAETIFDIAHKFSSAHIFIRKNNSVISKSLKYFRYDY